MIRDDLYISRCKVANQLFYHKRDKFYRKFYFHESILLLLHVVLLLYKKEVVQLCDLFFQYGR